MNGRSDDPHARRNLVVGSLLAVAVIAVFIAAVGFVSGLVAIGLFIIVGAILVCLLAKPTPGRRVWAAVLQPTTLLLLFMPKKVKADIKEIEKRERQERP